jgi:signal transduction histidine kinase
MHDTVIQGCTGISALLEAIASMNPQNSSTEGALLAQARAQIVNTINEARDAVWNLRHDRESAVELQSALQGIAMQAARAFGISVVCLDSEPGLNVPSSVAHELLMVVREAVANAGSHANASEIRIQTSMDGKDLLVSVEDNGHGFVPAEKNGNSSGHFGLIGMRERMQKIGGSFQVHSMLQKGTRVELRVRRSRLTTTIHAKGELA